MRRTSISIALIVLSVAVAGALLEMALHFLPVSEGLRGVTVDETNPVYRFEPNRTLRWSKGWNFSLVNEIRTNNYGFINDSDYDPTDTSPLLAIIGDSFVEAAMVPYGQTITGRLQASIAGAGRVYSFGASGAALSQYLAYARYARDEFRPAGLAIIIVGNDFDESLLKYRSHAGFHYFAETGDGRLVLERIDRSIPWWKDLVVTPNLGLYLVMNLGLGNADRLKQSASALFGKSRPFVGNVDADPDPERVRDSERAIDEFLSLLPEMAGLPAGRVVMVLDAPRPEIYAPDHLAAVQDSYFEIMRRYFISRASAKGFEIIDLEKSFTADYQESGLKFEFANDYHWNPTGHKVVAAAIQCTVVFMALFGGGPCPN